MKSMNNIHQIYGKRPSNQNKMSIKSVNNINQLNGECQSNQRETLIKSMDNIDTCVTFMKSMSNVDEINRQYQLKSWLT